MDPHAEIDLVKKIYVRTKASADQDYLPVVLLSVPHKVVDRSAFLTGWMQEN